MEAAQTKKVTEAYMKSFLQRLRENPGTLKGPEKFLGRKYQEATAAANKMSNDLTQLREQLRQGEERARNLELMIQGEVGKAEGVMASLIEIELDAKAQSNTKAQREEPPESKKVRGKKDNGKDQPVAAA